MFHGEFWCPCLCRGFDPRCTALCGRTAIKDLRSCCGTQSRLEWIGKGLKLNHHKSSHNYHNCTISRKPFLKGHQWCPISLAQRAPGAAETRSERDEHGRADASLGGPDPTWTVAKLFFWPIAMSHQITIHHIKDKDHGAEMNSASCACRACPLICQEFHKHLRQFYMAHTALPPGDRAWAWYGLISMAWASSVPGAGMADGMDGAVAAFPTKDWETPKWTWRVWLRCWDAPLMRAEGWEISEIFPKSSEIRQGRSKDFIMFAFEAFVHSLQFCDFLCGTWHWVRFLYHFVTFGTSGGVLPCRSPLFSPRVADFILILQYFSGSDPPGQ